MDERQYQRWKQYSKNDLTSEEQKIMRDYENKNIRKPTNQKGLKDKIKNIFVKSDDEIEYKKKLKQTETNAYRRQSLIEAEKRGKEKAKRTSTSIFSGLLNLGANVNQNMSNKPKKRGKIKSHAKQIFQIPKTKKSKKKRKRVYVEDDIGSAWDFI